MTDSTLHPADAKVLAEHGDAELIDLILPDMNGLLRGKRITRDALEKVYQNGVCLPMSLIATDITGNTVEETGLGYDIGDEDRVCRPVPGSLFHGQRQKLADFRSPRITLAHADLSGFSLFEEAQYRGVVAAERVLAR